MNIDDKLSGVWDELEEQIKMLKDSKKTGMVMSNLFSLKLKILEMQYKISKESGDEDDNVLEINIIEKRDEIKETKKQKVKDVMSK